MGFESGAVDQRDVCDGWPEPWSDRGLGSDGGGDGNSEREKLKHPRFVRMAAWKVAYGPLTSNNDDQKRKVKMSKTKKTNVFR